MTSAPYNALYKIGDRLILELKGKDIFNGIYVDGGKDYLVLNEVTQHNNENKLNGFYEFYRREIENIHQFKLNGKKTDGENNNNNNKAKEIDEEIKSTIKLTQDEYFRLKEMAKNFIYIENVDSRYFNAMKTLKDAESVGIVSLGMDKERSTPLYLVAFCTWKEVFILDFSHIENMKIHIEIKEILESNEILKIIHKSAQFVDVLYRNYHVYCQNIFDTQIVDLILEKTELKKVPKTDRNLIECLEYYLKLPKSLLEPALAIPKEKWQKRPLSDRKRLYAAQLVTYLIPLKNYLQNKLLLKDIYEKIHKVQDTVYDMEDFDAMKYAINQEVPEIIQKLLL